MCIVLIFLYSMAKGQTITVSNIYVKNAKVQTSVSKTVEPIVVDGRLVPDDSEINPGVIIRASAT